MVTPSPPEPILSVGGLTVEINGKRLLDDVSLYLQPGERVAVIGPNGAGKTSLLRVLAGLLPGGETAVAWNGRPLGDWPRRDLARLVAFVPQLSERLPPCPVFDFVLLARYAHGERWFSGADRRDRTAAGLALEAAGLTALADRDLSTLSGGERQKVLIAAALAQEAPVWFLDEPAAFLDYRQELEVRTLLARLHRESGKTVVAVIHDLNRGALDSDRIIALQRGRVVFDGPPAALTTPARLQAIFETGFEILRHPGDGRPLVVACEKPGEQGRPHPDGGGAPPARNGPGPMARAHRPEGPDGHAEWCGQPEDWKGSPSDEEAHRHTVPDPGPRPSGPDEARPFDKGAPEEEAL